jgi:hypothetical protein
MVAGGTGTARTEIEAHRVPDAARTLLGWRPFDNVRDAAAAESVASVFDISGGNYKFQPQEVLGPVGATLLLEGAVETSDPEYYDVFAPVNGGETISVGVEPLDAIAGNRTSGANFWWSDVRIALPVIYSLCSREVSVDGAGISVGTTLTLNNTHMLVEVGASELHNGVVTVEEEISVAMINKCTVWKPVQEITTFLNPIPPVIDATIDQGEPRPSLTRSYEKLTFTKETATVATDFDLDVDVTNASAAANMLRWI